MSMVPPADRTPDALESAFEQDPEFALPIPNLPFLLRAAAVSFLVSAVLLGLVSAWRGLADAAFTAKIGYSVLPTLVLESLLLATLEHVRWFGRFPCMAGMMIGMTVGMLGGFLPGYYVGGTNGLYVGCLFGMFVGMGLGIEAGRRSGVMSSMEGAMAGLMSGPMGAMTAVMLLRWQIDRLGLILLGVAVVILGALHTMIWMEQRGRTRQADSGRLLTVGLSALLTGATLYLMIG